MEDELECPNEVEFEVLPTIKMKHQDANQKDMCGQSMRKNV